METAHAVHLAFQRLVYEESSGADRASDVNVVSTYLIHAEARLSCAHMALNHYEGKAGEWFRRASDLDDDLQKMRAEVRQANGELAAVAEVAHALCDQIANQSDHAILTANADALRSALQGEQTERLITQIHESVKPRDVIKVFRRMLRKHKASDKLANAAESWLRGQLHL